MAQSDRYAVVGTPSAAAAARLLRGVICPRCGAWTRKNTEAEALADCPVRDYDAEDREAHNGHGGTPADEGA